MWHEYILAHNILFKMENIPTIILNDMVKVGGKEISLGDGYYLYGIKQDFNNKQIGLLHILAHVFDLSPEDFFNRHNK